MNANVIFKGKSNKCYDYFGSGVYGYAEAIVSNGYLIGIHYYEENNSGYRINSSYESLYESAEEDDRIVSPAELARNWASLPNLSDEELIRIAEEVYGDVYE